MSARYVVQCPVHTTGVLRTREAAEKRLERIEAAGACSLTHEVVELTPA